jgi:hypothetical protein
LRGLSWKLAGNSGKEEKAQNGRKPSGEHDLW